MKKGDVIKFRVSCRWGFQRGPRKVKKVNKDGTVEIRLGGWPNFRVQPHEITHINGKARQ